MMMERFYFMGWAVLKNHSIKKDIKIYPHSTKALIKSTQDAITWSDLKMVDIQSIINHSHLSFIQISMQDIMWGDKFLINEEK